MREPIISARIRVPPPTGLRRSRLDPLIGGSLRVPLTIIVAPAGSGKTTSLAMFAAGAGGDEKVAWYQAGASDADPARLLRYLEGAVRQVLPEVAVGWGSLDQAAAALEGVTSPLVIVVDDAHALLATAAEAALEELVSYLPPHVHVVLAGRRPPGFDLSRWRISRPSHRNRPRRPALPFLGGGGAICPPLRGAPNARGSGGAGAAHGRLGRGAFPVPVGHRQPLIIRTTGVAGVAFQQSARHPRLPDPQRARHPGGRPARLPRAYQRARPAVRGLVRPAVEDVGQRAPSRGSRPASPFPAQPRWRHHIPGTRGIAVVPRGSAHRRGGRGGGARPLCRGRGNPGRRGGRLRSPPLLLSCAGLGGRRPHPRPLGGPGGGPIRRPGRTLCPLPWPTTTPGTCWPWLAASSAPAIGTPPWKATGGGRKSPAAH